MLKRLFQKLENSKRPLLGPNVKALRFWGLLLPKTKLQTCKYAIFQFLSLLFVISEIVDVWLIRSDVRKVLENLKFLMMGAVNVSKVGTFIVWQKHWKAIIEYVTRADIHQRTTKDKGNKQVIVSYTKYCRYITYVYWLLSLTTLLSIILPPIVKYLASPTYRYNVKNGTELYLQVVSTWVPFDKHKMPGYLFASIFQSYGTLYAAGWIASYDTTAIVIMVFFKVEVELLRRDCQNMFENEKFPVSNVEAFSRIKEYHKRHVDLMKYTQLFNSCLSPIMLLYMLVCSVMLCATFYQIRDESSTMQRILLIEYLIFSISQLFMYCWHSNEVLYKSMDLMLGPYESLWWKRNSSLQKSVCILIHQFKKTVVFTAGPFTDLTVATFINILKGAYSYYTLLSQSQT